MKPFFLTLTLCCSVVAVPALAQDKDAEPSCSVTRAEITTLADPAFGATPVWSVLYAKEGMDVFTDVLPAGKDIVAAGSFTKDKDDKVYHPLLVKYDEKRKVIWESREDTPSQKIIQRLLKDKKGFVALGDLNDAKRGGGIFIGRYDDAGKKTGNDIVLYESGGELDAKAIVPAQKGGGYLVAAQFIDGKDPDVRRGIVYRISAAGKTVWKRSYTAGRSTVFNNLQTALDGTYFITGQIVLEGNISGGWIVNIDDNGAMLWQRNYPRGAAAAFQSAAQAKDGAIILTGKARPRSEKGTGLAAWIMKTDSSGNPIWQRYFKGNYKYEAIDAIVYEDGRASVLINGAAQKGDQRSHARLFTFSPNGVILKRESFTEGQNAAAARFISGGDGDRIVAGYAQTALPADDQPGAAVPVATFDAWLLAAVPLDLYEDTCADAPILSPIL